MAEMADLVQDVRFALRLLARSPLVTLLAAGSLALGIGSTTSVFSLVDALLLRPLPAVHAPESLVVVVGVQAKTPDRLRRLAWANYLDYASQKTVLSSLSGMAECDLNLTHHGPAERLTGAAVSTNYFGTLGLKPAFGRLLSDGDGEAFVAVIGHDLWQRRFGGQPGVVGSVIQLNGKGLTVVGIAPRGFSGTSLSTHQEVWMPLGAYSKVAAGILSSFTGSHDRKQEWLGAVGRLRPGVSLAQAQSALDVEARRLAAAYPEAEGRGVRVLPLTEVALGTDSRPQLRSFSARLLAVTALVLAVAVINVAGLLLTRALARQREIATRLSLGAGRGRLIRQFLVEGLLLALLGLAGGLLLAWAGLPLLQRLELPVSVAVRDYNLSWRTLGFALAVSLASCLLFALVPAFQAVRTSIVPQRSEVRRGRRSGLALRDLLAGAQVALTLLILIAAGLLLRTLANLGAIDPSFDPSRVLAVSVDLAPAGYEGPRIAAFYRDLLERLRSLPGVEEASMGSALPVMGNDLMVDLGVTPEDGQAGGIEPGSPGSQPSARHALVESRFFRTVKMKLLRGRDFSAGEASGAGVVILNETAARLLWGGRDALGRRLRLTQTEEPFEVIGVVADATYAGLKEEAVPVLYLDHAQYEKSFLGPLLAPQMTLFLRTSGDPRDRLGAVRETVRKMDPRLPVFKVSTLEDLLAATVGVERQAAVLYSGLALTAMALAMFGLWGVLTQSVLERTREIAIRVACGASPRSVRSLILRRSLAIALCGAAAGLAIAAPARRIVAGQLYGVGPADPLTWLGMTLVLVVMALFVSALPARRAAKVDPIAALR